MRSVILASQTAIILFLSIITTTIAQAQNTGKDSSFKPSGKLWGYAFGDYYYKAYADSLNRGGGNQYTGIEKGRNSFQVRRAYLGYNYDISLKFSAELLLAAEDNVTTRTGITSGDLLSDNKLSFYIKQLNIRWKNIWNGTDLIVGQQATNAYSLVEEPLWGFRFIERTIADIRRTPSFDLGVGLQGKFDPDAGNYGYNLLVANGTSAKPENDKFKWFYGDLYAKLFEKKLVLTFYADYQRMHWTPRFHHSRNMIKGFVAYTVPKFTAGVELFCNTGKDDVVGMNGIINDTLDAHSTGVSVFVRGPILKDKLAFFARCDIYNPNTDYDAVKYTSYKGLTTAYEPNNKERFIIVGLDFTPIKNVHFSPNIWYNNYEAQQNGLTGAAKKDHDLVYRLTFYYVYGR
jgi:hypothetical protein